MDSPQIYGTNIIRTRDSRTSEQSSRQEIKNYFDSSSITQSSSTFSDSDSNTLSASSEDEYGTSSPSAQPASPLLRESLLPSQYSSRGRRDHGDDSEDDVPLAKAIPTALAAQRSIRHQQRADRSRKRTEARTVPVRTQMRANMDANPTTKQSTGSIAPDELTRRLQQVQVELKSGDHEEIESRKLSLDCPSTPKMHSSNHSHSRKLSVIDSNGTPKLAKLRKSKHNTTSLPLSPNRSGVDELAISVTHHARYHGTEATPVSRSGHDTAARAARHQLDHDGYPRTDDFTRATPRHRAQSLSRSASVSQRSQESQDSSVAPPLPSFPASVDPRGSSVSTDVPPSIINSAIKIQQRIFIQDSQHHVTLEIGELATAGNIVEMVRSKRDLTHDVGVKGDWVLWELANDCGMERPMRMFERLSDVTNSWNSEKRVNAFALKKTHLAAFLAREAIPGVPPLRSGFVEWESRRGKWNKRWLDLREGSLFLAKKQRSKDEVFLCSMSNFDAYFVTARHRSPKPFTFALKSADSISLFENKSDYMHIFSCDEKSGQEWIKTILQARSFVLQQERTVLFQPSSSVAATNSSTTRKQIPAAPLVTVGPPSSMPTSKQPNVGNVCFEPGSLLAKRAK